MRTVKSGPLPVKRPASKSCLDCAISRSSGKRVCWEHWVEFMVWLGHNFRRVEFRHATGTERDRMVRNWVIKEGRT